MTTPENESIFNILYAFYTHLKILSPVLKTILFNVGCFFCTIINNYFVIFFFFEKFLQKGVPFFVCAELKKVKTYKKDIDVNLSYNVTA